jgi:ketosteroid isomerase-like protein
MPQSHRKQHAWSARVRAGAVILTTAVLLALISALPASGQKLASDYQPGQPPLSNSQVWNEQERAAVQLAEQWVAAWAAGDVQKAASFMAENFEFRGDPSEGFTRGRDAYLHQLTRLGRAPKPRRMDITEIFAIGSWWDTTVTFLRVDHDTVGGKALDMPVAVTLRIKNGKIQEWLDSPTIKWDIAPPNLSDCANTSCE